MITKAVFFTKYADVEKLNDAYTRDGHKLGSIVALDDDSVTIEKGFFFPKDFTISSISSSAPLVRPYFSITS